MDSRISWKICSPWPLRFEGAPKLKTHFSSLVKLQQRDIGAGCHRRQKYYYDNNCDNWKALERTTGGPARSAQGPGNVNLVLLAWHTSNLTNVHKLVNSRQARTIMDSGTNKSFVWMCLLRINLTWPLLSILCIIRLIKSQLSSRLVLEHLQIVQLMHLHRSNLPRNTRTCQDYR